MTVKQAQHLLAYLGHYRGSIDGIWGPLSSGAARSFQRSRGLSVTGALGPEDEEGLRRAVALEEDWWQSVPDFDRREFACKCGLAHAPYCDGFPAEPKEAMVRIAQAVRRELDVPVTVVSGLRCRQHNRDVGGVEESQHLYGEAADIRAENVSAQTLLAAVLRQPGVRYAYAINATNVHFDIEKGERLV